jgi:putative N6-adenine-specific DNA methylase
MAALADLGGRDAVALAPPGLEETLRAELALLGVVGTVEPGGVAFRADWANLAKVNMESRIAMRVVLRVAHVRATSLDALAQAVRKLPWKLFVHPRQPIEVEVAQSGGHLHRKDVVGDKVTLAVGDALRGPRLEGPRPPREPATVLVRLEPGGVQISIDTSGDPLHRRGWRQETAKAPIRENLAAAVLLAAGWAPGEALVDPMCGAGTFLIEAARMAAGAPPSLARTWAWQRFPAAAKIRVPELARSGRATRIVGGDRDVGAVRATLGNARRAGVLDRIEVSQGRFEDMHPQGTGLLVCNPPWGHRIDGGRIPWGRWAELLGQRWGGWRTAWVIPETLSARELGWAGTTLLRFESGGQRVRVELGEVPA